MKKKSDPSVEDVGIKRLYQAWASIPDFDSSYGEWYHRYSCPLGNPRTSAHGCHADLAGWLWRNKKKIAELHKTIAKSKRVGSDSRIVARVHQIWPMTENSPWRTGMFDSVIDDPFA